MEISEVTKLLKDFYNITGARVSLHSADFKEIAAYPKNALSYCFAVQRDENVYNRCLKVDCEAFLIVKKTGKAYRYKCHMGLVEIIAPIYHYGIISGYVMMGQITDADSRSLNTIKKCAEKLTINRDASLTSIKSIPKISDDKIESYLNILKVLANYLTASNAVRPSKDDLASSVKQYLEFNYNSNITIDKLCQHFNCSRATLMNNFKLKYGITVFNYINDYRLSIAAKQLIRTQSAIKEIAINAGYSDQNYFSKVFIKRYGLTPSEYRKQEVKNYK